MNEFTQLASNVLKAVGGKDNVKDVTHCATRLRFSLKDKAKLNKEALINMDGVLTVVEAGEQTQVVIGPQVARVYDELTQLGNFEKKEAIEENLDIQLRKNKFSAKKIGSAILSYVSASVVSTLPAMTAAAMIKAMQVLLGDTFHVIALDGSFYTFCTILFNSFFYFLPIYLGYTAAKKVKLEPTMGIMAGAMLVVPDFLNLSSTEGAKLTLLGLNVPLLNYSQTLLPVLLSVWVMSYVYKFFQKYIPNAVTNILTPFFTILVMLPITYLILAPLGNNLGNYIGNGLIFLNNHFGAIGQLLIGTLWNFLIMTGMHMVIVMVAISNLMQNGSDFTMVGAGAAQWAVLGMALGAFLRLRRKKDKNDALAALLTAFLGGITEPSLYGIGLKYKKPLIAMAIGGGIGGLYLGITHVGMYQVVMGGNFLTSLLAYVHPGSANLVNCIIGDLIAFVITAILTYFFGFDKDNPALN